MTADSAPTDPGMMLPWDTQFWGFPVARLTAATLTPDSAAAALAWCARNHVRCLYFLASGSCPDTLTLAHAHDFRFVDVRVELSRVLREPPPISAARVRAAEPDDLPSLQRLAAAAHDDSRFFKDARFDGTRAGDLYREWIARACARHTVLVCESSEASGGPCGYISCECDDAAQEGRIGLVAVAREHAHAGFGSALIAAALRVFAAAHLPTVRVVTQGTNVAALRLYERHGFLTTAVNVWFHKWFDPPSVTNAA